MITNTEAANRLGCDMSTVSRLRSGDRSPSTDMVLVIQDKLGWEGQKQLDAIARGDYSERFAELLDSLE